MNDKKKRQETPRFFNAMKEGALAKPAIPETPKPVNMVSPKTTEPALPKQIKPATPKTIEPETPNHLLQETLKLSFDLPKDLVDRLAEAKFKLRGHRCKEGKPISYVTMVKTALEALLNDLETKNQDSVIFKKMCRK